MFGIGSSELLLIGLAVLILFGPDKLPEIGRTLGKIMREFNKTKDIMESQIRAEMLSSESREKAEAKRRDEEASKQRTAARADDDDGDDSEASSDEATGEGSVEATPGGPDVASTDADVDIEEDEEG